VKPVQFSDPAAAELAAAVRWYEQRRVGLGADFFDAVASTIELIRSHPEIGAERRGRSVSRQFNVKRFPYKLKKMLCALDEHRLVDTDPADRWCIKPELAPLIRQILEPSALAQRCLSLADDVRSWVSGQAGLIDTNAFEDRFREPLTAVREKLARDYAITDPVLTGMPSGAERVRAIADALMRIAWELPADRIG
jgi:plasmid stabilization system protein ParE